MPIPETCWCQSGLLREQCCQPILAGTLQAPTAEALMRSRYSAYVTQNADHLMRTWHPQKRPLSIEFDPSQRWLGLKVKRVVAGNSNDLTGIVEFVARYKINGKGFRLTEVSRFERANDTWLYLDGDVADGNTGQPV